MGRLDDVAEKTPVAELRHCARNRKAHARQRLSEVRLVVEGELRHVERQAAAIAVALIDEQWTEIGVEFVEHLGPQLLGQKPGEGCWRGQGPRQDDYRTEPA